MTIYISNATITDGEVVLQKKITMISVGIERASIRNSLNPDGQQGVFGSVMWRRRGKT